MRFPCVSTASTDPSLSIWVQPSQQQRVRTVSHTRYRGGPELLKSVATISVRQSESASELITSRRVSLSRIVFALPSPAALYALELSLFSHPSLR